MRLLLIGHGKMGRLVERLAPDYGCEIAGIVTEASGPQGIAEGAFGDVSMAVDFSVGDAVAGSLPQLAARGISVVIGTTGWGAQEPAMRELAGRAGIGVLAAANFSLGVALFRRVVADAARRFEGHPEFGAWIHEIHHAAKKDAPSGTALAIEEAMIRAGYTRRVDVSSTRAGSNPGAHVVGFDGPAEALTFAHEVRDRSVFAHGALAAAKWLHGRRGWFTIDDLIEDHL